MMMYTYQIEINTVFQGQGKLEQIQGIVAADSLLDATQKIIESYEYDSPDFSSSIYFIKIENVSEDDDDEVYEISREEI